MKSPTKEIYLIAIVNTEQYEQQSILSIEDVAIGAEDAKNKAEQLSTLILKCVEARKDFIHECANLENRTLGEDEEYSLWELGASFNGLTKQEFRYSWIDSNGICIKKYNGDHYNTCACHEVGFATCHPMAFEL